MFGLMRMNGMTQDGDKKRHNSNKNAKRGGRQWMIVNTTTNMNWCSIDQSCQHDAVSEQTWKTLAEHKKNPQYKEDIETQGRRDKIKKKISM